MPKLVKMARVAAVPNRNKVIRSTWFLALNSAVAFLRLHKKPKTETKIASQFLIELPNASIANLALEALKTLGLIELDRNTPALSSLSSMPKSSLSSFFILAADKVPWSTSCLRPSLSLSTSLIIKFRGASSVMKFSGICCLTFSSIKIDCTKDQKINRMTAGKTVRNKLFKP